MFVVYWSLEIPEKVTLGDGRCLDVIGRGTVALVMKLLGGKKQRCKLWEVLFVLDLLYSLLSVSKVSEAGKMTKSSESGFQIVNVNNKLIACASRCGSLYMLECECCDHAYTTRTKEDVLAFGSSGLRQLAVEGLVEGFDYDGSKKVSFCEPCTEGKHHRSPFISESRERVREPLELVHSDVWLMLSRLVVQKLSHIHR